MKDQIIFIANNNVGNGFSGGDRIFVEFIKSWSKWLNVSLIGSEEAVKISMARGADQAEYIISDQSNPAKNIFSISAMLRNSWRRTKKGLVSITRHSDLINKTKYIYSVSDFYPDFYPAYRVKRDNPNLIWIAGYYLFAPSPFSKDSPYRGKNALKGLLYWLMQRPSYYLVNKYADVVLVTSEPDVKRFITEKRKQDKVIVVQGGVDISESEKYLKSGKVISVDKREYDACFVGRFHFQKGVIGLIDIWHQVCQVKPEAKLVMIGDGELVPEIKAKIKKLNLNKNIKLVGFADGEKKYDYFKKSKMILHPATYDSGGMAAAEGMAWGLPGVSYDLEALKTYYPKGMLKTKINDTVDFAQNIIKLLDDQGLYTKISQEALDLIRVTWDWSKRAEKIFNLIITK